MAAAHSQRMSEQQVYQCALELLESSEESYFATIDLQGLPAIRGMMIWHTEGLQKVWFAGLASSRKIVHLRHSAAAGIYVWDGRQKIRALALTGNALVVTDSAVKRRFWRDSLFTYYTGPDDPEYCIIEFTTRECDFRQDENSYVFVP